MNNIRVLCRGDEWETELAEFDGELMVAAANRELVLRIGEIVTCELDELYYECRLIKQSDEQWYFFVPLPQTNRMDQLRHSARIACREPGTLVSRDRVLSIKAVDISVQGLGFICKGADLDISDRYLAILQYEPRQISFHIRISNYHRETGRYGASIEHIEDCELDKLRGVIFQAMLG